MSLLSLSTKINNVCTDWRVATNFESHVSIDMVTIFVSSCFWYAPIVMGSCKWCLMANKVSRDVELGYRVKVSMKVDVCGWCCGNVYVTHF